jgi:hypothetical protein
MSYQLIKISNVANQNLNFTVNGQNITMTVYNQGYTGMGTLLQPIIDKFAPNSFFANLYNGTTEIISGVTINDAIPINAYPNGNFIGYLAFFDVTNVGQNPTLDTIGITSNLYYYTDPINDPIAILGSAS